jgi:pimeloyl-ACP methyl ester carboxylesterase
VASDDDWFRPYVSFRQQPSGGGILNPPIIDPQNSLNSGRVVLLIHGYNDDRHAATEAYKGMVAIQGALGPLTANLVGVYWPGDNWENFAFYMQSIGHAVTTAGHLADVLRGAADKFGTLQVSIVAHSMGCRLAFELLDALHGAPNIRIDSIVVMAAAVATFSLQPPGGSRTRPLRAAFDRLILPPMLLSLYSPDDPVLRYAFPLGQSLAGEGLFPTALGHAIWSGGGALTQPPLTQTKNRGARHGDYWFGSDKAKFAQGEVRKAIDLTAAPPRPTPASAPMARETEPARTTPSRSVSAREV